MDEHSTIDQESLAPLIAAAQDGDQAACAAIYRLFVHPVYRLACGVLLDQLDAEEVVQDTFVYALHNLARYDPSRSAFRTWLYTIAISRCRNKRRRKWLLTVGLDDLAEWIPGGEPLPDAVIEQRGIRDEVLAALRRLSPKLREAITLRYFEGLTYREMAEVLDCPLKTAESRVRLAHDALYRLLADRRDVLTEGVFQP